jgi:Spy/CpxP family protein refolding chaperone
MVALLAMGVMVAVSSAQSDPGMKSSSPEMRGGGVNPPEPSGEFSGRGHGKHSLEAMQKRLGITDDQKKQIRALYVGFRDRTRKARTELMSLKDEKKTMVLSGKIDQQKLAQMDDQTVKLATDLMKEKLKLRRDRLALLTPEQLGRLADWQAEKGFRSRMQKMHWGRGHGQGMRGEFGG